MRSIPYPPKCLALSLGAVVLVIIPTQAFNTSQHKHVTALAIDEAQRNRQTLESSPKSSEAGAVELAKFIESPVGQMLQSFP